MTLLCSDLPRDSLLAAEYWPALDRCSSPDISYSRLILCRVSDNIASSWQSEVFLNGDLKKGELEGFHAIACKRRVCNCMKYFKTRGDEIEVQHLWAHSYVIFHHPNQRRLHLM